MTGNLKRLAHIRSAYVGQKNQGDTYNIPDWDWEFLIITLFRWGRIGNAIIPKHVIQSSGLEVTIQLDNGTNYAIIKGEQNSPTLKFNTMTAYMFLYVAYI